MRFTLLPLLLLPLVAAHARIKYPVPLAAPPETLAGNAYNAPLAADGSQFPCKGLHKSALSTSATTRWRAGERAYFEILGHGATGGEGTLAAHSGGSCQASLSLDGGVTWRVLHSFEGGCPRGAAAGSNLVAAGTDQRFEFVVPARTRSGAALFAWTWIAVSGNRGEFYMNCARVEIVGGADDDLRARPHMFLGDMHIAGHIAAGQCASVAGAAVAYPHPGENATRDQVDGIPFTTPSDGDCVAPGAKGADAPATTTTTAKTARPAPTAAVKLPSIMLDVDETAGRCGCVCAIE